MIEVFGEIAYWHWIIFGLLLSVAEIFVMSFVLLWFGISAIMVGVLLAIFDFSLTIQIILWKPIFEMHPKLG